MHKNLFALWCWLNIEQYHIYCNKIYIYFCTLLLFLSRYFSLQATNPLGFGDSVRMMIESNICREGGPLPDCFTTPLRQAWTTMEKVRFPDCCPTKSSLNVTQRFSLALLVRGQKMLVPKALYFIKMPAVVQVKVQDVSKWTDSEWMFRHFRVE